MVTKMAVMTFSQPLSIQCLNQLIIILQGSSRTIQESLDKGDGWVSANSTRLK